ncbi:MAG: TIGR00266 family protein [Clostridiales bacterium]|nr:TIGR00266 family protein [Clostridiales bacterium]
MKYSIEGDTLPVVICNLSQGERMLTEKGAMSWMTPNMEMSTSMEGGLGKAFGRAFSGESMFMNYYTCTAGEGMIAFASSFPGRIIPLPITAGNEIVVQKTAFLAAEAGVQLSTYFTRKFTTGFFGGEGFIMQKLSGQGTAFLEIDGHVVEYDLAPGQTLQIDSGHLAAMTETVRMDVVTVKGLKNKMLGGEGFFNTQVTGPGHVWIQTMPFSKLATMALVKQ